MNRKRLTITLKKDIIDDLDRLIDGQKIRNRSHAIEVILSKELKKETVQRAIILGGGQTIKFNGKEISKLLLPMQGKTLLEVNIDFLKNYGIKDVLLSVGAHGKEVREKIGDGSAYGIKVLYFERDLSNANILRQAKSLLDQTFLMMNGDILLKNIDLKDLYDFHRANKALMTICLATDNEPSVLGAVVMKGNKIIKFKEKDKNQENESLLVNAGVYIAEPKICELVTAENQFLEYDIFPALAEKGELSGYTWGGKWLHLHDLTKYNNYLATL